MTNHNKNCVSADEILENTRKEDPESYAEIMLMAQEKIKAYRHGGKRKGAGRKSVFQGITTYKTIAQPQKNWKTVENLAKKKDITLMEALDLIIKEWTELKVS